GGAWLVWSFGNGRRRRGRNLGRPACPVWATRRGQSRWEGCRRADASGGMGMLAAETGDQLVAENQMAPVTPIDALRRDGTTVAPFTGRNHAILARCLDRGHEPVRVRMTARRKNGCPAEAHTCPFHPVLTGPVHRPSSITPP